MAFTPDKLKTARDSGYTDDEIWDFLGKDDQRFNLAKENGYSLDETITTFSSVIPAPAAEPEPERREGGGITGGAADVGVQFMKGLGMGTRMISDVFGANNPVSQKIAGYEDYMDSLLSAESKKDSQEISRILKDAEGKGILPQIMAGLEAFTVAPAEMTATTMGMMLPNLAGGVYAKAAQLTKAGVIGLQMGIGAAQGAGSVKGQIYTAVQEELRQQGLPEDQIDKVATEAQAYNGKNLDQILIGAGLGAAASSTGAEKIMTRLITGAGKEATEDIIKATIKGGLSEAPIEALQGGQEKIAENVALQRIGVDVPTMQGVIPAATMEATAGLLIGGGLGGVEAFVSPEKKEEDDIDKQAQQTANEFLAPNDPTSQAMVKELARRENAVKNLQEAYDVLEPTSPEAQKLKLELGDSQRKLSAYKEIANKAGLSLPITTAEQQQIELAKQIAAPAEEVAPVAEAVTPAAEVPAVEVAPVEPAPPVAEAPAVTPAPVAETPAVTPAPEVAPAIEPLTDDQAETIRDVITLRKSQGREPNPEQVKRLAEYDARKAGVEVQAGDIISNIVVGHPLFEAPQPELQNLVPIKIQNKEQLASSIRRTEEVRNKAQSYIGQYQAEQAKAKTAPQKKAFAKKFNKSELDRQRDILDYINNDVMPELDRMEKAATSAPAATAPVTAPPVTEAVTPAPEVAPIQRDITKPEQMTPKEWKASRKKIEGNAYSPAVSEYQQKGAANSAIKQLAPVSVESVDEYGIKLPKGYTKQGDLYVYQPTPAVSKAITPAPEVTPAPDAKRSELGMADQEKVNAAQKSSDSANALELIRSNYGELSDIINKIIDSNPKIADALTKIAVEKTNRNSFDGETVRINSGYTGPKLVETINHEIAHAFLAVALREVPSFREAINSIRNDAIERAKYSDDASFRAAVKLIREARALSSTPIYPIRKNENLSQYMSRNSDSILKLWRMDGRNPIMTYEIYESAYALASNDEFLAHLLSDQRLREELKKYKVFTPDNRNLFQKFIDAVKGLFKKLTKVEKSVLDKAMEQVEYVVQLPEYKPRPIEGLGEIFAKTEPAPEKPITDPATPDEQTQQLVQQAQEQESLVDSAVKEAGTTVFDVFNRLVNEGKTEDQVAKELGISNYDVRKYKLRADTAILNKMKQNKVKPLAFAPKNPVAEFAEKNLRKYFTKEGWLPKAVFQSWVKRNAALSREQKEAEFAIKDLYAGIREVFGISKMEMITKGLVSVPPEFVQQLNDALAKKININTMPEPVREPLTRMRQHIDAMSRQLVDLNVLPDELSAKISENLGVYLTRSYKIFTDKNWINKIPTEKLTAARNFLHQQQLKNDPEATIEMADRELRNMLNDWASDAEGLRKRGGKLGAKDLTVMMERAKVPKVLREVMGENTNVIFNYANTIGKISRFVSDQKFLNEVKAKGTGEFLFTEKDAPKGFNTQIAAEESRTMSPLNGLRTTPEIAKAFEEFGKGYDARENPGLYVLAWMNAVGKLNLTVGSVLTQIRNLLGQPAFFVFNGHYNWRVIRQEIDAIAKEKGISQEDAKKELVKLAAAQGLVNENAYAGELRTAFQDVGLETFDDIGPDEFTKQFVLTRMYLKGVKSAQELYQKTDEFGKIVGWLNETKRIQRMNKGMDKQTAQSIAAERTRDTYPTYSQSSEALRLFRRQPFVGPFATFFYETFRTSFHNLRYAFEDINGPTPEHKAEGIKRLAGAMTTLSMGAFGINLLSKLASGIGDDEEEDVRRMLPPWAKDASLAWMPKSKDGTYNFINVSYINPYNAMTDPFIAMMSGFAKGDKPEEIAAQALGSFLSPFSSEQPVTATIADAMRNRTETGKQIYNPQDDITTKTSKIMLHIFGKTFTPGTITRLRERIIPAIQGETVGTRAPAPAKEIAAELTGIRFETLDMKAAFSNKAWEFSKAANESERIFRDVATRRRRVDEQEQIDAYRRSEQTRYEIWNDMYRDYMAVRRAGASPAEAIRLMTDIGISKKEAIAISKGRYVPYQVSDEVLRRSKLNENKVPIKEIRAIGKEMPRVLTDITKTP